jgi:hypothetical protein
MSATLSSFAEQGGTGPCMEDGLGGAEEVAARRDGRAAPKGLVGQHASQISMYVLSAPRAAARNWPPLRDPLESCQLVTREEL